MNNNEIDIHDEDLEISQEAKSLKKCEDNNNKYNEGEDSLSNNILIQSQDNLNKGTKDAMKRTYSTISTSYSEEISPDKIFVRKSSQFLSVNSHKNDYINVIINYFRDTEEYIKNNNLEKNDYKKSNNYKEKQIFFKENELNKNSSKYETIESSEDNYNIESLPKNNNQEMQMNNKKTDEKNNEKNWIENNKNINNNILATVKSLIGNKYDLSMAYLGYYTINCKSLKINFYMI